MPTAHAHHAQTLRAVSARVLRLAQSEYVSYFAYGWDTIATIPFTSAALLVDAAIALLVGGNVGLALLSAGEHTHPQVGWLGALGAGLWTVASSCFVCNAGVLSLASLGASAAWLAPWAPTLQWLSALLLCVSLIWQYRRLQLGHCPLPRTRTPRSHARKS